MTDRLVAPAEGDRSWRRSHWAFAVVRASRLPAAAKLLYQLIVELDRGPRGAFQSQRGLADQLGLHPDHVGELRQHLLAVHLVRCERRARARRGEARESWFALSPVPGEVEHPPEGATGDERRAWIRAMAARLNQAIEAAEQGGNSPVVTRRRRANEGGNSPLAIGEIPLLRGLNRGEFPGGQGGNSPVVPSEDRAGDALSVTLQAVGQRSSRTGAPDGAPNQQPGLRPTEGVGHPATEPTVSDQALRDRWNARRAEQRLPGGA